MSAVDLDPHLTVLYDAGWRSMLAVPMLARPTGSSARWSCAARRPVGSAPRPCELLETFASQSAMALTNARLYRSSSSRAPSWRWPAGTSRSSWRACRTSCAPR